MKELRFFSLLVWKVIVFIYYFSVFFGEDSGRVIFKVEIEGNFGLKIIVILLFLLFSVFVY